MLIRKRRIRKRIWRDFLQSMAAFMVLSAVLLFCSVSILTTSSNKTEKFERTNVELSETHRRFGERILQYRGNGATSVGVQRHNRVLQFMDSGSYDKDLQENNKTFQQRNNTTQTFFNDLKIVSKLKTKQNKGKYRESSFASRNRVNSSLNNVVEFMHSTNRTSLISDLAFNLDDFKSMFESNLTENMDSQLDNTEYILSSSVNESRHNFTSNEDQIKRLPSAIIIGVKKAGTRALLEFLRLHPNVEGTGPEPHFFDRNYEKGLQWYRDLMPRTRNHQVTVEKTPGYFVTRDAPKRIFDMNPGIKLILVVRDPVTRAISDYCQAVSKHAMKPFENMALLDERLGLVNTSWGAIKIGVYAKHMERWLQVFSLDQIHLVDGQMLIEEPAREVAKVETFLGLPKYIKDSHFYLRGFKGTFPCLIREGRPHCLDEKTKGRDHPVVKESVLQRLRDFYRPFNAKFFQMVGRNFDWS